MPVPFDHLFVHAKPVVAVLHVGPSPGVGGSLDVDCAVRRAVAEARLLAELGVDGFLVENTHDVPGVPERHMGPEIPAFLTRVAAAVRRETPRLPLGVRVHPRAGRVALAVSLAVDGGFAGVTGWDRPDDEARAGQALRYRRTVGAEHVEVWAEVRASAEDDLETVAARAATVARHRADALIVTGPAPGVVAPLEALAACADAGLPVLLGSGLDAENLAEYAPHVDGFVVGSSLKENGNWRAPVCERRVRALIAAAELARGHETLTLR
jgi:uncharacterized protein